MKRREMREGEMLDLGWVIVNAHPKIWSLDILDRRRLYTSRHSPAKKPQVAVPKDRTRSEPNGQAQPVQVTENLKLSGKCRLFIQGHCEFGDLCKRSHGDSPGEATTSPTIRIPVRAFEMILPSSVLIKRHATTSSASTLSRPNARTTTPHSNPSPGTIPDNQVKTPCFSWGIRANADMITM
ncbi:hypothetical protein FIBSPDRAFT_904790 [Athelia psychrophila]|uniref:C3H1-type domain-containing protein n=1 Tax=Athelia psychrophila TaxID=1759441 RepID=A0A167UAE2_9AGAM|nr:hypothetical protein FIBSPDRAFT_904790 [Fibularhizoctonia sp. CBS 109695]